MQQNVNSSRKQTLIKIACVVFTVIGICFAAGVIYIAGVFPSKSPILLGHPQDAQDNVVSMMDCLCAGDFSGASQYILGNPDFGTENQPKDAVGLLIWNAYIDNMSYELVGTCYATEAGLAQKIRFTYLDVADIIASIKETSEQMLENRVENAEDISDIYNEDLEYREDVVMEILQSAASSVIEHYSQTETAEIVVTLQNQGGQWRVVSDIAFMDAIFGDILF